MSRPPPNDIYTAFINDPQYSLLEADRNDLHVRRGFSDEVIDLARLGSARPENEQIVTALQDQFERDRLIDSGLLTLSGGAISVCRQLLEPGVLIPYLSDPAPDAIPKAYHLRVHKLGFKGVPIQFYCAGNQTEEVILAESEFKAVASYCFGYTAIGIPGVGSFCREHFGRLVTHVHSNTILRVVVCFDNEVKNDPELPHYKPEPDKRWDTPYYAALMARRLAEHCNIETAVATLPDAWRVNGKIDIDGALAAGHTADEFAAVVGGALRVNDFIDSLGDEARRIVVRKLEAFRLSLRVRRNIDGYSAVERDPAGVEQWVSISNFTFDIQSKIQTPEGLERVVVAKKGRTASDSFRIKPNDMVKPDNFQTAMYRHGSGEMWFRGTKDHLIDIFDLEHNRGPEAVIIEPNHVGKITNRDMWLLGSTSIINGKLVAADSSGVFWNGVHGYSIKKMNDEDFQGEESRWHSPIPRPDFSGGTPDLKGIARRLWENFGGEDGGHHAVLAMSWALAAAYSNDFFARFHCFPVLYLCGPKESGKSTLARWLLRMYGIFNQGFNVATNTTPGLIRQLSYYSSLPLFLDECKKLEGTGKDSILRSVYDRQSAVKAKGPNSTETVSLSVRAAVMMAGEEVPSDAALTSRCIFPEFSKERKGYGCQFDWLDAASETDFPKVLPWILLHGPAAGNLIQSSDNLFKSLRVTHDPRVARNYGIALACYSTMIDPDDELGIGVKMLKMATRATDDGREDTDLQKFFEDLPKLREKNLVKRGQDYETDGVRLFMSLRHCWEAWQKIRKEAGYTSTPSHHTALKLLRQMKVLEEYNFSKKLGGINRKCVVLNIQVPECPVVLKDFATTV